MQPFLLQFGYEYYNPALAASIPRSKKGGASQSVSQGNSPSRKREPNVVARLMGLEALPDELPTRKFSQPGTPTCGSPKPGLIRQRSQGAVPSSWQRPPLPRRAPAEERVLAPVLSFRDHPQEEQLQKFKKEFEAKQQAAFARKQEQLRTLQLEDMNRELEEKKEKVRATLDKAKSALSQAEPKRGRLISGQGQFEESKEFLDAMKFLQSNKDFIFQFLQPKPESNVNSNSTTPVLARLKKGKGNASENRVRKRDGFSPRAFARLFMNPRKWNDSKQRPDIVSQLSQPVTVDRCKSSASRREAMLDDVKQRTSSSTNSRSQLRAPHSPKVPSKPPRDEVNKSSARDVISKIKERLRQREQCDRAEEPEVETARLEGCKNVRKSSQKNNFTRTEYLSTGKRVSMRTEDMDDVRYTSDGEDISTPLVTIVRENARRSSISLPSSPHLSTRSHDVATSSRSIRKRATEKPGTPPAAEAMKNSESPRRRGSQSVRGSLLSNTEVERTLLKSASVNENASRSEVLQQRVEASGATSSVDQSKEPASNLTRCRSIPNVALLRGQCSSEAVQRQSNKSIAKTKDETAKHVLGQKAKGFFSGGRKKAREGSQAMMPSAQHMLFPSSTPVLARFAALAESCVSRSNTLSDADTAVNVNLHVRSRRNAGAPKEKENPRAPILLLSKKDMYLEAESVVSESSADSDAGSCDDEFLEALSQLPPIASSTTESLEALPSPVSAQQQVHI